MIEGVGICVWDWTHAILLRPGVFALTTLLPPVSNRDWRLFNASLYSRKYSILLRTPSFTPYGGNPLASLLYIGQEPIEVEPTGLLVGIITTGNAALLTITAGLA